MMIDSTWADFWWNYITGANMVVENVSKALQDNQMVILRVPGDLPWRYQMRSTIELLFRKNAISEEFQFSTVDAIDECGDTDPGRFLLDRYCTSREIKNGYRSGSKKTIQQYLLEHRLLHNLVIWIKGMDNKQRKSWIKFCKGYEPNSMEDGLFVLEVHDFSDDTDAPGFKTIRFDSLVSSYDVQLLGSFIAEDKRGITLEWRKYISTVAASICDTDAEIAACMIGEFDIVNESPLDAIKAISSREEYLARGADDDSHHVFAHLRNGNMKELEQRLWKAQLKTLFPIIEMERIRIIEMYADELSSILRSNTIEQYKRVLINPYEIELGTMCYFIDNHFDCFHNKSLRERISFLHECRNKLAHARYCEVSDVKELLEGPCVN